MAGKGEIERLMDEALQRGRAAERVKGLAALSLVVREYPDNLVAFLWLARCVSRAEAKVAALACGRSISGESSERPRSRSLLLKAGRPLPGIRPAARARRAG
jgi:hypothetical protein